MMSLGRLLLAIQFLTCLSLTPTSPAKVAFFHDSPCLSDPSGRVPRRKCQSSRSPKLNPLGGSSTSGEGMTGPFPKISIERQTASDSLVSFASRHNPAGQQAAADTLRNGEKHVSYLQDCLLSVKRHSRSGQLFLAHGVMSAISGNCRRCSIWSARGDGRCIASDVQRQRGCSR